MANQTSFRLYLRKGFFLDLRFVLMFLQEDTLLTMTLFSALWKGKPVTGLEVRATGLEIGQDGRSVTLSMRTQEGSKRLLSLSNRIIAGITDLEDQDIVPPPLVPEPFRQTFNELKSHGWPDPDRFFTPSSSQAIR